MVYKTKNVTKANQPKGKKPTNIQIQIASARVGSIQVPKINAYLKSAGYSPIDKARRDRVLPPKEPKIKIEGGGKVIYQAPDKKIENNQSQPPAKKKQAPGKRKDNGGARKGSGRKVGAATKRTRQIADDLAKDATRITPLDFMLDTLNESPDDLRKQLADGKIESDEFLVKIVDLQARRYQAARDAAPYIHPRLSSIEAVVEDAGHEKWLALLATMGK